MEKDKFYNLFISNTRIVVWHFVFFFNSSATLDEACRFNWHGYLAIWQYLFKIVGSDRLIFVYLNFKHLQN